MNGNPTADIGCAARFRQFTIASSDFDLVDIGGHPCRGIALLSVVSGALVLTPANPIDPNSPDETIDITNLPVGQVLPIQANAIKHVGSAPGAVLLVLW